MTLEYPPNRALDSVSISRVSALRDYGLTQRQREFLVTVMVHWVHTAKPRRAERLDAVLVGGVPALPCRYPRVRGAGGVPNRHGKRRARRPQGRFAGAGPGTPGRVCLGQFLPDVRDLGVARAYVHRRRRRRRRAARGGDEFSHVAGELRLRSVGGRRDVRDQRSGVHGDRRRAAGLFRSEGRRLEHARPLAAADEGTAHRRRHVSPEESGRPGHA